MEERQALTVASALGEAAFKAALRAIAMLLITLVVAGVIGAAAIISSAIQAAQSEPLEPALAIQPAGPAEDIFLIPAREPSTRM